MAILDSSHVFLDCSAATRDEALELAASKAVELGATSDAAALLEGLKAREAEGSTGMMGGFAIPHCKSALVSDPCIVVLRFSEPVEWQAMDKAPIDCAIALFIPDGELGTEHLRILSKLAASLMHEDFCHAIKGAADADAVVAAINEGLEN
ncbi:fructose PTS transporter subunit IIA [Parolsenella catena]|uniref:fructose PTS transporter subunit IIA n=1 Tax=Parolsenella catena TaxID=2003188 RepID=UPI002FE221D4